MRYKLYHWYHVPTEQGGMKSFADTRLSGERLFLLDSDGSLSEVDAVYLMNLWNRGVHHEYRYWVE